VQSTPAAQPQVSGSGWLAPLQRFRDCEACPEMVVIPGSPRRRVQLTTALPSGGAAKSDASAWRSIVSVNELTGSGSERSYSRNIGSRSIRFATAPRV